QQWAQARRRNAEYVHIITWNDYGEATEISPSSGTQFVFYDLAAYYVRWFKLGYPPLIRHDALYYLHRRQLLSAPSAINGAATMHLRGATALSNHIELIAFLTAAATLEIEVAGHITRQKAPAGLAVIKAPANVGRPIFRIVRDGKIIISRPSDWTIN